MGDGWLEGPELASFFEIDIGRGFFDLTFAWVGSAHGDPGFEFLDSGIREARFGWHLEVAICVGDGLDEEGILRISRNDGGAGIASGMPAGAGIEGKVGFQLFGLGRVALVAMFGQERADMGFEVFDPFGFISVGHLSGHHYQQQKKAFCWR